MGNAFDKIAGYKEEKKDLMDLCGLFKRRVELTISGGKMPRGLFLYGPCGVGKTKLAKAFIKESGCRCVEIKNDDLDKGVVFSKYLEMRFKQASSLGPCIVFIDELDKFAGSSFDMFSSMSSPRSQGLLDVMNKYEGEADLFFLLIANNPFMVDNAITRSGRIDKKIHIDYPNKAEREEILRYYCKDKCFDRAVNLTGIAKMTDGLTGADLESLVNDALIKSVINEHPAVNDDDVMDAFHDKVFCKKGKGSGLSASHEKLLAFHEAGHAAVSLLCEGKTVFCATIISRGAVRGYVGEETKENKLLTMKDLKNETKICLAGMAAEEVFLKERTVGSSSDLEKAQKTIKDLVRLYGVCGFDKLDTDAAGDYGFDLRGSEHKKRMVEEAEAKLFNELYESAKSMLIRHEALVRSITEELVKEKVLYKEDLCQIYADYQKTMRQTKTNKEEPKQ